MYESFLFIISLFLYVVGSNYINMKRDYKQWVYDQKEQRRHVTDNLHHEHKRKYVGVE